MARYQRVDGLGYIPPSFRMPTFPFNIALVFLTFLALGVTFDILTIKTLLFNFFKL